MAYIFGDGFDCYAAVGDAALGYWDNGATTGVTLVAGRFAGGQALQLVSPVTSFAKTGTGNDALHHVVLAFQQTAALSGTTLGAFFQFMDSSNLTTPQCTVCFRSDGAIMLTTGGVGGTVIATYTGGVSAANTWFAYEFEVFISSTAGYMNVRRNGNTTNDFTSATNLNTRGGTTNNYANTLRLGSSAGVSAQKFDDLLWRSDASSVPWVGDIRCYTRMPASDASVQFSKSPTTQTATVAQVTTTGFVNTTARYSPMTAALNGTVSSVTISLTAGYTGNLKCAFFTAGGAVIQSAAAILNNPATGNNTFNFSPVLVLTKGTTYYFGFISDTTGGTLNIGAGTSGATFTTSYAAFPSAAVFVTGNGPVISATLTPTDNCSFVNEAQQDGATTYVYDSNVGDADFYNIAAIGGTPASTVAVTTRGFFEKSDAGTRNGAVQLRSGSTTVTSTSTALSTSWGWLWRVDTVDPATGAAWTPTGVNNATIGPTCTA